MSSQQIKDINSKYRNKNCLFIGKEETCEGIYIGSWIRDHYSYISFNHTAQSAGIQHIHFNDVKSISSSRDVESSERENILVYLKKLKYA